MDIYGIIYTAKDFMVAKQDAKRCGILATKESTLMEIYKNSTGEFAAKLYVKFNGKVYLIQDNTKDTGEYHPEVWVDTRAKAISYGIDGSGIIGKPKDITKVSVYKGKYNV